jgi:hypothetical protein
MTRGLDEFQRILALFLEVILAGSFVAVLVFATLMVRNMSESEANQGGVFYVLGALTLLLVIGAKFFSVRRQRKSR